MELRRVAIVRDHGVATPPCEAADTRPATDRTFYQEKVTPFVRVGDLRHNERGSPTGITSPTSTTKMLLAYRDTVVHPGSRYH